MSKPARVESRAYFGIEGWSYKNKKTEPLCEVRLCVCVLIRISLSCSRVKLR